jgi:hypothetical protein
MFNRTLLTLLFGAFYCSNYAQAPVDVTDQTIKIKSSKEEEILFGFAEGDKILFNFEEVNKKDLKEVEILEYPSTTRFAEYKIDRISNKELFVRKQGVFIFRFKNTSLAARVCRIHIQRIPATTSTLNFNPTVNWITKQDTLWNSFTLDVLIGYDTTYNQVSKRELVNTEQREDLIIKKSQRVHSTTNNNSNRTSVFFTLPQNKFSSEQETNVVAWAYWVGVGEEANKAWKDNVKAAQSLIKAGATAFTTPLGALAIGAITELLTPKLGEDVQYAIVDEANRNLFINGHQYRGFDFGKGKAGFKKFTHPQLCQGTYFICLENDNIVQGIDSEVMVIAIIETKNYTIKTVNEPHLIPRYEKQLKKEPAIKTVTVPVAGL